MLKEFKNFIMTGNVIDFAVAVIMAGALGAVIKGFVNNIAMPFIGYFAGGMDFAELHITMDGKEYATVAAAKEAGAAVISYGAWINTIINLIIVGFVTLSYNHLRPQETQLVPVCRHRLEKKKDNTSTLIPATE